MVFKNVCRTKVSLALEGSTTCTSINYLFYISQEYYFDDIYMNLHKKYFAISFFQKHRILMPDDEDRRLKPRQSIVFFGNPDDNVLIQPVDGSEKYEPIRAEDFLRMRFYTTFKDLNPVSTWWWWIPSFLQGPIYYLGSTCHVRHVYISCYLPSKKITCPAEYFKFSFSITKIEQFINPFTSGACT